jgi:hypothetical protein
VCPRGVNHDSNQSIPRETKWIRTLTFGGDDGKKNRSN